jgi:transposase
VKTAQNNGDFAAKEWRVVMKYLLLKGNSAERINVHVSVTLRDKRPSYSTVKNWVAGFRTRHFSTECEERSRRPTQVTIPENLDAIHSMILNGRRISAKKIAETLTISRERVGYTIHEILDMRKFSAKWVPRCLNADQKCDRVLVSQDILDRFRWDPVGFFSLLVTIDETWIHIRVYDPETKEQSKEWKHSGSPRPKKFKTQNHQASCWRLSSETTMRFSCRLPRKGCNRHGKVLRCTSQQTEAATGLQTSRQAFERNLVSSRQCCSSQSCNYTPEIGRCSL